MKKKSNAEKYHSENLRKILLSPVNRKESRHIIHSTHPREPPVAEADHVLQPQQAEPHVEN